MAIEGIPPQLRAAMDFAPLDIDQRGPWSALLAASFGADRARMLDLLDGLHRAATVIAWGAWDGGTLAGQYSCLMLPVAVPGRADPVMVGFSFNMAVHPDYRGQGLIKRLAAPVYAAVGDAGGIAGVGFSNAQGVRVDRRSSAYQYRVVGRLQSSVTLLLRPPSAEALPLTDRWPAYRCPDRTDATGLRLAPPPALLQFRYVEQPWRAYRFAVRPEDGQTQGVVAYRPVRVGGIPGAALLAVHGNPVPRLVAGWARAMWQAGTRLITVLGTPSAAGVVALRALGPTWRVPFHRSPYYLTVRPLGDATPPAFFDFQRWDCLGGDIL